MNCLFTRFSSRKFLTVALVSLWTFKLNIDSIVSVTATNLQNSYYTSKKFNKKNKIIPQIAP